MMKELAKQLTEEIDELVGMELNSSIGIDRIRNMNHKQLNELQASLKLVQTYSELLVKEAEMMDEMNKKLDKLLQRKGLA